MNVRNAISIILVWALLLLAALSTAVSDTGTFIFYSFTDETHELCLTPCLKMSPSESYCKTKLNSRWQAKCHVNTRVRVRRAPTFEGDLCDGPCRTWGYSYNWCYKDERFDKWDYCHPQTGFASKRNVPCMSKCENTPLASRPSCLTAKGNLEYCLPDSPSTKTTQFYTWTGAPCNGGCERAGQSYYWCYTDLNANWDVCSPWPSYTRYGKPCLSKCTYHRDKGGYFCEGETTHPLIEIGKTHLISCAPPIEPLPTTHSSSGLQCTSRCGHFGESYEWCYTGKSYSNCNSSGSFYDTPFICRGKCNGQNAPRIRRQNPSPYNERNVSLGVEYECNVAQVESAMIVESYLSLLGDPESGYVFRTDFESWSPMRLLVRMRVSLSSRTVAHNGDVELTTVMAASIRPEHLQRSADRPSMPGVLDTYLSTLNPENGDERGHLLAFTMGGTDEYYNIVPQPRTFNRGTRGLVNPWVLMERRIRHYLHRNQGGYRWVRWSIVVNYDIDVSARRVRSFRPTGFLLDVYFMDGNNIDRQYLNYYVSNTPGDRNVELRANPCGLDTPVANYEGGLAVPDMGEYHCLHPDDSDFCEVCRWWDMDWE